MATADPFMDELRIMSYTSRPRACKDLYKTPRRGDFIEVLWYLDDLPGLPEKWCPAGVLHVYDGSNVEEDSSQAGKGHLAKGVILYLPGETWDEQVDEVEFLDGHKLRCAANKPEGEIPKVDGQGNQDLNPAIRWRFRDESTEGDEDDLDWKHATASDNLKTARNARLRARSDPQRRGTLDVESRALRDGHAFLTVELEKVKRELVGVTRQLKTAQNQTVQQHTCTSAHCVLPRLRHKIVQRMQTCLKQNATTLGKRKAGESDQTSRANIIDGMYYDALKIRVECTLQQFEKISCHVKARCPAGSAYFYPEFAYTQLPSQCSTEFRILFKTFSQICEVIGINSTSDKKEMARKCGRGSVGDLLRMLGTYAYDSKNETFAASFFPGTSCGTISCLQKQNPPPPSQSGVPIDPNAGNQSEKADQQFPVLTRKTREWKNEDARYLHKIRLQNTELPDLGEDCEPRQAFAGLWKRATDNIGKAWSFSLSDKRQIFGWLEVNLPFEQVQGEQRCKELGGLATDDMWDKILGTESS